MKKILMGSFALMTFSVAIIIFQMSCKKEANAQTTSGTGLKQLNKIIYVRRLSGSSSEIWTANSDGSNQAKVNISLPTGIMIGDNSRLSPDGQTIFFEGVNTSTNLNDIYSSNVDGSNVQKIVDGSLTPQGIVLGGSY